MEIAIIADNNKKEVMAQFCIAYCGILSRHHLCATHTTGSYISEATGLDIETVFPGRSGTEQIASKISYNEIDLVLFFRDPLSQMSYEPEVNSIMKLCDIHNIPLATNVATAEVLIHGLERGDLDWRDIVNPKIGE